MGMNAGTQNMLTWGSLENDRVLMRKSDVDCWYKERYKIILRVASADNDYFLHR